MQLALHTDHKSQEQATSCLHILLSSPKVDPNVIGYQAHTILMTAVEAKNVDWVRLILS